MGEQIWCHWWFWVSMPLWGPFALAALTLVILMILIPFVGLVDWLTKFRSRL